MKALLTLALIGLMSISANADIHKRHNHNHYNYRPSTPERYYAPRAVVVQRPTYRPWYGFGIIVVPTPPPVYRPTFTPVYQPYRGFPSYGAYLIYQDQCRQRDRYRGRR